MNNLKYTFILVFCFMTVAQEAERFQDYVGLGIGNSFGQLGVNLSYERNYDEGHNVEVVTKFWKNREVKGMNIASGSNLTYDGYGLGILYKYIVSEKIYLKSGIIYRRSSFNKNESVSPITENLEDIAADLSVGNFWLKEKWVLSFNWLSYTPTLYKFNNFYGFKNKELSILNFTALYAF